MQPLSSSAPEPTPRKTSTLRRDLNLKILFAVCGNVIFDNFKLARVHVERQFVIDIGRDKGGVNFIGNFIGFGLNFFDKVADAIAVEVDSFNALNVVAIRRLIAFLVEDVADARVFVQQT